MVVLQAKIKHFLSLILIVSLVQSCAFHNGTMTGNAAISDANFTVEGFAFGTAKTIHVFGIGGLGKDAIVLEAKRNMYNSHPLKPGQAFANVTVDFKRGMYIVFNKTVCTITADIIDFNKQPSVEDFNYFNFEVTENIINKLNNFRVGEQVYYSESTSSPPIGSTITAFSNGKAQIRFVKSNGIISHSNVNISTLYKISNDSTLRKIDPIYQIGDSVYFRSNNSFGPIRGQIFALGYSGACIAYESNNEKQVIIARKVDFRAMKTLKMEQIKNSLLGTWKLVSLANSEVANNAKTPTLVVNAHDLKLSGFGGCNRYFGSFSINENSVTISALGATRMACMDENIENDFFKAFGSQSFNINRNGKILTLKNSDNSLSFELVKN